MADDFFNIVSDADAVTTAWEQRIDALTTRLDQQRLTWDSPSGDIDVTEFALDLAEALRTGDDAASLREIGWAMYWNHDMPLMLAMYEFLHSSLGREAAVILNDAWAGLCGWKHQNLT